jgi:nitrite reductase/ring-hydroxylating ferredoxin subunit
MKPCLRRYVRVAEVGDIGPGEMRHFDVEGYVIAIANVAGTLHAFSDICPHADGPLHEGCLEGHVVICPWHDGRFDIRSGEALTSFAPQGIPVYPVRIDEQQIEVEIPRDLFD